jgi:VanZ family protein
MDIQLWWYRPALRWFAALAWTALLLLTLLQSSSQPVIGPPAPPGDPSLERELLLTLGHIIGFAGLTLVWRWALADVLAPRRALWLAVLIALLLGICTELAQAAVPDRAASGFDLMVNGLAALTVGGWLSRRRS